MEKIEDYYGFDTTGQDIERYQSAESGEKRIKVINGFVKTLNEELSKSSDPLPASDLELTADEATERSE